MTEASDYNKLPTKDKIKVFLREIEKKSGRIYLSDNKLYHSGICISTTNFLYTGGPQTYGLLK